MLHVLPLRVLPLRIEPGAYHPGTSISHVDPMSQRIYTLGYF